jgi:transposase
MGSMRRPSRYSPEVRERSVRMVLDQTENHSSQWAAIESVASKIGCTAESLRRWVRQFECDSGVGNGLTTEERSRLKELERENRELRRANEILRKAAVFSPRRSSTANRSDGVVH